jgi:hypothetical protein
MMKQNPLKIKEQDYRYTLYVEGVDHLHGWGSISSGLPRLIAESHASASTMMLQYVKRGAH